MNVLRDHVTFEARFPDDSEDDAEGRVVAPAGRNVATTLIGLLASRGLDCAGPSRHSFYGWSFETQVGRTRIWVLLQDPGPWLLLSEVRLPILRRIFPVPEDAKAHAEFLCALEEVFKRDARFESVSWFTKAEYSHAQRLLGTRDTAGKGR